METNEAPNSQASDPQRQVAAGNYTPVPRDELLPATQNNLNFTLHDATGTPLPVYVEVGKGEGNNQKPSLQLMSGEDGKQYLLINEGYHKWTENYAAQQMAKQDGNGLRTEPEDFLASLKKAIKDGAYKGPPSLDGVDIDKRFKELRDFAVSDAKAKGVDGLQVVIGSPFSSDGVAEIKKEGGTPSIALNSYSVVDALASDQSMRELKAIIQHENKHIADGDTLSPRTIAETHNNHSDKTREMLADRGVDDTQAAAANLEKQLTYSIPSYNQDNPGNKIKNHHLTFAQFKHLSDWQAKQNENHPSVLDRIAGFELQAALKKDYEKSHSVATADDRKRETDIVSAQVMQRYSEGNLPAPSSLKAGMDIPDSVKLQLEDMKPLPMKNVDSHTSPGAPTPAKDNSLERQ